MTLFSYFVVLATAIFSSSLQPKVRVCLHSLTKADFNGRYGELGDFNKEKGRWEVKLSDQDVLIKPENIRLTNAIDEIKQMSDPGSRILSETRNVENALIRNENGDIGFVLSEKSNDGNEQYYREVSIFWLSKSDIPGDQIPTIEEKEDLEIRYYRSDNCYNMRTGKCGKIITDFWRNKKLQFIRQGTEEEAKAIRRAVETKKQEKTVKKNMNEASAFERHVIEVAQAMSSESGASKEIKQSLLGRRFHYSNYGFNDGFYTFEERKGRIMLKENDNDRGKIQYYEYTYDEIRYFDFTVEQLGDEEFELTLFRGPSTEVLRHAFPWSKDRITNGIERSETQWIGFSEHVKKETIPSGKRDPKFAKADEKKLKLCKRNGKWQIEDYFPYIEI